jgi:hypothetical protein
MRTNLILNREQLEALGLLVGEFARLEATLDLLIMDLARLSEEQYALFMQGKTLGAKLSTLRAIGVQKLKSQEKTDVFVGLLEELARLNSERNLAVHGIWQPKGGFTLAFIARAFNTTEAEAVHKKGTLKAERLSELVNQLDAAHSSLYRFWNDTWLKPRVRRSLRRKPPQPRG